MKKALLARVLARSGLRVLLKQAVRWSGLIVLNYHRIGDGSKALFDRGLWSAQSDAFAEQIRFCKAHLELITPDDLPRVRGARRGRYAMITFDDGYRDNFEIAFPILKAAGVPATFFVATGYVDVPCLPWWDEIAWMVRMSGQACIEMPGWLPEPVLIDEPDRESAVRQLLGAYKALPAGSTARYLDDLARATGSGHCEAGAGKNLWMTWAMLREMRAAGMVVGGHTITHPVLARTSPERQREEILGCARRLAAELGEPMRYFSYPVGNPQTFDAVTRNCLREAEVSYAFSYYGGFNPFGAWDDYNIRRVKVERYLTADWFQAIVSVPRLFA
jgi:peptidoglycan/xylan/chitin deacetylase (PgdA/CDA1 family)